MHLLAAKPGGFVDDQGVIDLDQTPGDLVILSAADSGLGALALTAEQLPTDYPSVRLANWVHLSKPAAFDLYQQKVIDHAKVVVLSLLGGSSYWSYGFEQLQQWAANNEGELIIVPGDDGADPHLFESGTVNSDCAKRIWRYLREAGQHNFYQLYGYLGELFFRRPFTWQEPRALPKALIYQSGNGRGTFVGWQQKAKTNAEAGAPVALLLFYRSHLQSVNTAMFDSLMGCLEEQGLIPLPIAIVSLKDAECLALVNQLLEESQASIILNTTGFTTNTVSIPDLSAELSGFQNRFVRNVPVLQMILSSTSEEDWWQGQQGLRSRDIAMQIALPEMDGRVITRAVSFKASSVYSERCEIDVVCYRLQMDRAKFVAQLASAWCRLSKKPAAKKRISLILANYPTKDGRIGNGVGLDTPASTINILVALQAAGYPVEGIPNDGNVLIEQLLGSVTNNPETLQERPCQQSIDLATYNGCFSGLPESCQQQVLGRWGHPESDPKYRHGRLMLAGIRFGETFVGIQPARGFNMDLAANYHDPDLVPPHSYLAFYFWLRHCYQVDAVVHVGKHGNLEWLPGKGTALSQNCWPDIALGPMPHIYPFIVNDPGEGAQAKRRAQAVIIDHLMPPMTRAETYGPLAELECLVDEYYQALGLDIRREVFLRSKIIQQVEQSHVLEELKVKDESLNDDVLLQELDTYLCDIKEAQIRDGLHCLGQLPEPNRLRNTIVALLRLPRGSQLEQQGILHAIAKDLQLKNQQGEVIDPLRSEALSWRGERPAILQDLSALPWRTEADTRERIELLAVQWVEDYLIEIGDLDAIRGLYPNTAALLLHSRQRLMPALQQSARCEIENLVAALAGRFVAPGPSGAPTRGRLDTLPTGRNFYSLDSRAVPSPAAWELGQLSAEKLIERHLQEHGDYPSQLGLSVWGTATMRTGGDDIAQAFALMGIRPVWAAGSQRVVDFEIVPGFILGRPRVDVTLRVSGFFRDAFPQVMLLFDAAVWALADLQEPGDSNTIRQHVKAQKRQYIDQGMPDDIAARQASYRVFGSKPGAYGAGLQGLLDERCWESADDLAEAYINWGGYAYGNHGENGPTAEGVEARATFKQRLGQLDVVVQNQDNREHDLLDSDDYYQFQGGMMNAVRATGGQRPAVYHADHSNPALPKVRTLKEELNRVIRSRVINPKWIEGMRKHGYKGAFEMAASIDYLFAYDATTQMIDDYQYEEVSDALVFDPENQQFLRNNNPNALEEMAERLLEATQRGLWEEPGGYADRLQNLLLELDNGNECIGSSSVL